MTVIRKPRKPLALLAVGLLISALTAALAFQNELRAHLDFPLMLFSFAILVAVVAWYFQRLRSLELEYNASRTLERNRQVMATISDVVFRADFSGRLVYVNQAWEQVAGSTPQSIIGTSIVRYLHPEDQPLLEQYMQRVREGTTETLRADLRLRREDGRLLWCRLTARPYSTVESGDVVIGTLNDIQQQQEQMRIQSARMSVLDGLLGEAGMQLLADRLVREWEGLRNGQRASIILVSEADGTLCNLAACGAGKEFTGALEGVKPGASQSHSLADMYRDAAAPQPTWSATQMLRWIQPKVPGVIRCAATPGR